MTPRGRENVDSLIYTVDVVACHEGVESPAPDEVCREEAFELVFNSRVVGKIVASPSQLEELGAGFVISEALASSVTCVCVDGNRIQVEGVPLGDPSGTLTGTSGGLSTGRVRGAVTSCMTIRSQDIFRVMEEIVSPLWERTGGAHCSVLFVDGAVIAKSSDIGRHNTVDKVIGRGVLEGIDLSRCVLGCTGRQPEGMVVKAINAGIPVVVSKAATTDRGVLLAREKGLTLVCRVRDGHFRVYAHPERIVDLYGQE